MDGSRSAEPLCFKEAMSNFRHIEELEELGMWQSALVKLNRKLESEPNKEVAIRLLFVCWYTLIEWGCLELNEEAEMKSFKIP